MRRSVTSNIEQTSAQSGAEASTSSGSGITRSASTGALWTLKERRDQIQMPPTPEEPLTSELNSTRKRYLFEQLWFNRKPGKFPLTYGQKELAEMVRPNISEKIKDYRNYYFCWHVVDKGFYPPTKDACDCDKTEDWAVICDECYEMMNNPTDEEKNDWESKVFKVYRNLPRPGFDEVPEGNYYGSDQITLLYHMIMVLYEANILEVDDHLLLNVIRIMHKEWDIVGKKDCHFPIDEPKRLKKTFEKIKESGTMSEEIKLYYQKLVGKFALFYHWQKEKEKSEEHKMDSQSGAEASTSYSGCEKPQTSTEQYKREKDKPTLIEWLPVLERSPAEVSVSIAREKMSIEEGKSFLKKLFGFREAESNDPLTGSKKKYKRQHPHDLGDDKEMRQRTLSCRFIGGPLDHAEFMPKNRSCACENKFGTGPICDKCYEIEKTDDLIKIEHWFLDVFEAFLSLPFPLDEVPTGNRFRKDQVILLYDLVTEFQYAKVEDDIRKGKITEDFLQTSEIYDHLLLNVVRIMHKDWDKLGETFFSEDEPVRLMNDLDRLKADVSLYKRLRPYYAKFIGRYVLNYLKLFSKR